VVHYRKHLRFSWSAMEQAEESLRRLTDFLARLGTLPAKPANAGLAARLTKAQEDFGGHIAADLNTSGALSVVFDLVRELNTQMDAGELGASDADAVRATFQRFDQVLGVLTLRTAEDEHPPIPVAEIEQAIAARREARLARNFAEADRIRKDLESRGVILEDTGATTRWKKK